MYGEGLPCRFVLETIPQLGYPLGDCLIRSRAPEGYLVYHVSRNESMYVVNTGTFADMHSSPEDSSSVLTQITLGTEVNYIEDAANGYAKINYKYQDGYVKKSFLTESKPSDEAIAKMKVLYCSDQQLVSDAQSASEDKFNYMYKFSVGAAYGADYSVDPSFDESGNVWFPIEDSNIGSIADLKEDYKTKTGSSNIPSGALGHYKEMNDMVYTNCEDVETVGSASIKVTGVSSRTESQAVCNAEVTHKDSDGDTVTDPATVIMVPGPSKWNLSAVQYSGF